MFLRKIDEREVAIFRVKKNQYYAVDNHCYHAGGPLLHGRVSLRHFQIIYEIN